MQKTDRTNLLLGALALFLLSFVGCATAPARDACPSPAAPDKAPPPLDLRGTLLEHVPAQAVFAAVLRPSAFDWFTRWYEVQTELKQAILAYTKDESYLDSQGLVVYADGLSKDSAIALVALTARKDGAVGVRADQPPAFTHEQVAVYQADDGLFRARWPGCGALGTRAGVTLAIDRALGKVPALSEKDSLGILVQVDGARTEFLLAADVTALPKVSLEAGKLGVQRAALTIDRDRLISAYVAGPPNRLVAARMAVALAASQALGMLKQEMEAAIAAKNDGQAISTITGYHLLRDLLAEIAPKAEGGMLVSRYQIPAFDAGSGMLVMFAGTMAAVAVPAFIKYMRKSKTVEATEGLARIGVAAKAYYLAEHQDRQGKARPRRFPPGEADWTPQSPCCANPDKKCLEPTAWAQGPWRPLGFQLAERHYFQWRYRSAGQGKRATFEAEARADLDCDGAYSSFKISGAVDQGGQVVITGPIITNEIE